MAGYNEIFVNSLDEDVKCCYCHLPLRKPVQTRCGHRLCRDCLEELTQSTKKVDKKSGNDDLFSFTCPVDNVKLDCDMDTFLDKATERKILSLIIRCPNGSCEWTGPLGEKEKHLDYCLLLVVSCTNENCEETIVRKNLDEHVTVTCQWRMIHCSYCSVPIAKYYEEKHLNVCAKYPVECLNACGKVISREKITDHTENDCPLEIISCPYVYMGCDFKTKRNQVQSHLQSATSKHLDLACLNLRSTQEKFREKTSKLEEKVSGLEKQINEMKKVNSFHFKKIASLSTTHESVHEKVSSIPIVPSLSGFKLPISVFKLPSKPMEFNFMDVTPQLSWKISGITEMLKPPEPYGKTELQSEAFYSSINGYKMKVSFYPRGTKSNKNGYSSVFLVIMKGEYDEALSWPFRHKVVFTLIDQKRDPEKRSNRSMELIPDPSKHAKSCAKPTQLENPRFGFSWFHLIYSVMSKILDDSLLLEVRIIKIK